MTKVQLIDYIINNFEEYDGSPISKAKLDSYKKADLEELVTSKASMEEAESYCKNLSDSL